MIMNADPVVQCVMAGLALASVACWAIIFEKMIRLRLLSRDSEAPRESRERRGRGRRNSRPCRYAARGGAPRGRGRRRARGGPQPPARPPRARHARRSEGELQRLEVGLPFLATIGSAAPFVGLFGTVWGIMNSFTSIAQQQDTSLAIVAPGIAEALFATALGLAAAIPAVMAYNAISVSLGRAANRASTAIAELAKNAVAPAAPRASKAHAEPLRAGKASLMALSVGNSRGGGGRRGRRLQADGRDQHHAHGRRDAGAAHHLHGRGAADGRRRADRAAEHLGLARRPVEEADGRPRCRRRRACRSATSS